MDNVMYPHAPASRTRWRAVVHGRQHQ